jgi:2OG-Fe(II) oxygenase superfamily
MLDAHLIQLAWSGTHSTLSSDDLSALQTQFRQRHCVHVRQLLSGELLAKLMPRLATATFQETVYEEVGTDLCMTANPVLQGLHFAVNDPVLLGLVQRITDSEPLGCFEGRVYRMLPESGHLEDWHSDRSGNRLIGMSINLSSHPYGGGLFQLRETGQDRIIHEAHNTGFGDAIMFRISRQLEHRVTPVTGDVAKTAFAGWFRPAPFYWDAARES